MNPSVDELLARNLCLLQSRVTPDRLPIEIDQRVIGSVSRQDAHLLVTNIPGVELDDDCLVVAPVCSPDSPAVLDAMAQTLRDHGRTGQWRNELLPVTADDGTLVGAIERACIRPLGIRSFAVHCVGECAVPDRLNDEYTVWLQRRALDKAVDPGKLDTLAGGLIGMQSPVQSEPHRLGLSREIQEEAGLNPEHYEYPVFIQTVRCQADLEDEGYFEEDCIVYRTVLKPGITPENQDGEVCEFFRVGQAELLERIAANELTETASIATLLALKAT